MEKLFIFFSLTILLILSACANEPAATVNTGDGNISPRSCVGDYTMFLFTRGKCKNDCTRGLSIHCGGYVAKYRCGTLYLFFGDCYDSFNQSVEWEEMPAMAAQDTTDAVKLRMEIPDRYHARFVVLKDESEELEFDSTFTISNNARWVDETGYTFGLTTFHNFQFVGGDYPIVVSQAYPFGSALIDIVSY